MSDLISRQDAIDAVCANCLRQDLEVLDGCLGEDCSIKPILESLPSAQTEKPEIIMCKDCKYYKAKQGGLPWKHSRRYCNRSVTLATSPYDFCSFAEGDDVPSAEPREYGVLYALTDRTCPFQSKEFAWCLTCPHISEEDRELVRKAVEGSEPKVGEWIKATGMMPPEFHGHHCCSECGAFANMDAPFGNREDLRDYCPNCGAKMEV